MASETQAALEKAWASTCRVLFSSETCSLENCAGWLGDYIEHYPVFHSAESGEEVAFPHGAYLAGAKAIALGEVDFGRKFEPLSINEMKDVDSLVGALGERAFYAGNVVLGNSSLVEKSTSVLDSHFVLSSSSITSSKYVAYSQYVKNSEYIFGILGMERSTHAVKSMGSDLKRCFECHMVEVLSDCYYCAKAQNCQDCMFCFGVENGSHMIGNTKLAKGKYASLKKKLLSEISEKLGKDGEVFSVFDIIKGSSSFGKDPRIIPVKEKQPPFDVSPIEKAFSSTCSLLFKRDIGTLSAYSDYLKMHVPQNLPLKSAISKSPVLVSSYRVHIMKLHDISKRMATDEELRGIGKVGIGEGAAGKLSGNLQSAVELLHPIAYMNLDKVVGQIRNMKGCTVIIDATDCLDCSAPIRCKRCAHAFWPSSSEAIFGSSIAWDSSFCMKCFHSKKLTRAFECDSCENCSDIYFSHNCENVRDSMFCFNKKNIVNAIGNAELPAESYRKIKNSLVSQIADELEEKKTLKWSIFNLAREA